MEPDDYSGFKTLGTDIDEAYSMMGDEDLDDLDFEDEEL